MFGILILAYLSVLWTIGQPIGDRPLLLLGVLLVIFGGQMVTVGLLGELVLRRTIRENDKYSVAETVGAVFSRELPLTILPGKRASS